MKLESGIGNGKWVAVDINNRMKVRSESFPYQNVISNDDEQAYQLEATTNVANGSVILCHVTNTSTTRNMVLTYIRHQVIDTTGGSAFPNASNYFTISTASSYSSGGAQVTPVNVNLGSGNSAELVAYQGNPTLSGSGTQIDRWYTKAEGDMNLYNKEGSLIVRPGKTLELGYTSDHTAGFVYTRMSFVMANIQSD